MATFPKLLSIAARAPKTPAIDRPAQRVLVVSTEGHGCEGTCRRAREIVASELGPAVAVTESADHDCEADLVILRGGIADRLAEARRRWRASPMLGLFCPSVGADILTSAFDAGMDDFLCCPFSPSELVARVNRVLPRRESGDVAAAGRRIRAEFHLDTLVGESACLLELIAKLPSVAASDATCLITGETGTGKEVLARSIHYVSPRRSKPFVPVNCGGLPDHLFENELFGHARGAYTDARSAEIGLVAIADGGTLFLDEIDALTPAAQVKLLRFLQDHQYRPLGTAHSRNADVRIIAATNSDLRMRADAHEFREDLFYRLNVINLLLPSLRQRAADVPLLAAYFLRRYAAQYRREVGDLRPATVRKLLAYDWPGNVRQLESVIQSAIILSASGELTPDDLQFPFLGAAAKAPTSFRDAKTEALQQFEHAYLIDLLAGHSGNVSRASRAAGKDRRAFQRLIRRHGLSREAFMKKAGSLLDH